VHRGPNPDPDIGFQPVEMRVSFSFKHSAVAFRWDTRVDHVGQVFDAQLPSCAGGQYSRSSYKGGNDVYAFQDWGYVFNRVPTDPQCGEQIAKEYQEWKYSLQRVQGKSVQELWE
jgi:hypothetical protein